MNEITDLHILAQMSNGTPNEDDAFIIRDSDNGNTRIKIHSLDELVDVLSDIPAEEIFPSLCRLEEERFECDIALWVHYVLGDAVLSAKMLNLVREFHANPQKLKIEVFNLCFNRYLNFQEVTMFSEDLIPIDDDKTPPTNI